MSVYESCGGRNRTCDTQIMSLMSYHCSTPLCLTQSVLTDFLGIEKLNKIKIHLMNCILYSSYPLLRIALSAYDST